MTTEPEGEGIRLSQDPAADAFLARSPFALLVGTLLEQSHAVEIAFRCPYLISQRLGTDLTPAVVVAYELERFVELVGEPPAIHIQADRMANRIYHLAAHLSEQYGGDPTRLWRETSTGDQLRTRIGAMPGFGKTRARILLALLGKQFGITPDGWREASAPYGEEGTRLSVADVTGPASLLEVRAAKKELKAANKASKAASKAGKQDGARTTASTQSLAETERKRKRGSRAAGAVGEPAT